MQQQAYGIAVVGMAGRFPGAGDVRQFWQNICAGTESIRFLSREELEDAGVDAALIDNPDFVPATTVIENMDCFDAGFFGFSPREAAMTDPQQRVFLECSWEALEDAGYVPEKYQGRIGVFAGAGVNSYFTTLIQAGMLDSFGAHAVTFANDKDYLAVRVSYKLNLRGPSLSIQTACSTSLTAVHVAVESLRHGECDMALAGAVTLSFGQRPGYLYVPGMILSPDGHCRVFDADARGTVFSRGAAVVILKRLEDAIADRDHIYAVIRGTAVNNDGASKVGFTAPSIEGQAEVVSIAQNRAGFSPEDIAFIEAHGTGTELGDPIEVRALEQVFRERTTKTGYCAIGSVKSNIGHMDTAAGMAGLIKSALALKQRLLPPTLHFERPNPHIDFASSPFFVAQEPLQLTAPGSLKAGVSAFGIGGTNAHVCLEEPPDLPHRGEARDWQVLPVGARSESAVTALEEHLASYFEENRDLRTADVAYTLQTGRRHFEHRAAIVCDSLASAAVTLRERSGANFIRGVSRDEAPKVMFLFPGQGAQHPHMARSAYQAYPVFKAEFDACCDILKPSIGHDLRDVIYADAGPETAARLNETWITQPALFTVEYALARLWMAFGVVPAAMIGHSIGEYAAACIAGVFSLEDALALVAARGSLMQAMAPGAMLVVQLPESQMSGYLTPNIMIAAVNAPGVTVVSGPLSEIEMIEHHLTQRGVGTSRLHTSHAFHSSMMDAAASSFLTHVEKAKLAAPALPYVSNVTGDWITAEQATDPGYWCAQLRQTVRFGDGLARLAATPDSLLLEVGPGQTLSSLARMAGIRNTAVPSLPHPRDRVSDEAVLLGAVARLWVEGVEIDWEELGAGQDRRRVPLPTYPFERKRHIIEAEASATAVPAGKRREIRDWFYVPSWKRLPPVRPAVRQTPRNWLLLLDNHGAGERLAADLERMGEHVVCVRPGSEYDASVNAFTICPSRPDDYDRLFDDLESTGNGYPDKIVHLWNIVDDDARTGAETTDLGFYALLYIMRAQAARSCDKGLQICVVTNSLHDVTGERIQYPARATVLGMCRTIPIEHPHVGCRAVDIVLNGKDSHAALLGEVLADISTENTDFVALRNGYRWGEAFESLPLNSVDEDSIPLRHRGVYLITGGLGGIGLTFAASFARMAKARLVLIGRSPVPPREHWSTLTDNSRMAGIVRQLREMEEAGAEVMTCQADVTDLEQMRSVIESATRHFGRIDGVIHAAGIAGGGMIAVKTREVADAVLKPKVDGTLVLDSVLEGLELDFLLLCSSTNSLVGIVGQADYSAANLFLDTFAQDRSVRVPEQRTISVNWDSWRDVGMVVNIDLPATYEHRRQELLSHAIAPHEGVEALRRILTCPVSRVIVSTREFGVARASMQQKGSTIAADLDERAPDVQPVHEAPEGSSPYVAPDDDVERAIVEMWQEILGISRIGMNDNFFELGGHSLLGTQLMSRIRARLNITLPLRAVFEATTARELANRVKTVLWATSARQLAGEDREEIEI